MNLLHGITNNKECNGYTGKRKCNSKLPPQTDGKVKKQQVIRGTDATHATRGGTPHVSFTEPNNDTKSAAGAISSEVYFQNNSIIYKK